MSIALSLEECTEKVLSIAGDLVSSEDKLLLCESKLFYYISSCKEITDELVSDDAKLTSLSGIFRNQLYVSSRKARTDQRTPKFTSLLERFRNQYYAFWENVRPGMPQDTKLKKFNSLQGKLLTALIGRSLAPEPLPTIDKEKEVQRVYESFQAAGKKLRKEFAKKAPTIVDIQLHSPNTGSIIDHSEKSMSSGTTIESQDEVVSISKNEVSLMSPPHSSDSDDESVSHSSDSDDESVWERRNDELGHEGDMGPPRTPHMNTLNVSDCVSTSVSSLTSFTESKTVQTSTSQKPPPTNEDMCANPEELRMRELKVARLERKLERERRKVDKLKNPKQGPEQTHTDSLADRFAGLVGSTPFAGTNPDSPEVRAPRPEMLPDALAGWRWESTGDEVAVHSDNPDSPEVRAPRPAISRRGIVSPPSPRALVCTDVLNVSI
jgi:hypothetical protein